MSSRSQKLRIVLFAIYGFLVAFPCFVILAANQISHLVMVFCACAYALPLFLTVHLDYWLLGGVGFWSWIVFALFVLMTTISVWPLPVLAIVPSLWKSPRWRHGVTGYAVGFVILVVFAAIWMRRHGLQILFG